MTTPSKLEQVARAIMCARPESDGVCLVTDWQAEAECNPNVATALSQARAAIAAMELPTEEMVDQGQNEVNLLGDDPDPPNAFEFLSCVEIASIWSAMIRAALKEEK